MKRSKLLNTRLVRINPKKPSKKTKKNKRTNITSIHQLNEQSIVTSKYALCLLLVGMKINQL